MDITLVNQLLDALLDKRKEVRENAEHKFDELTNNNPGVLIQCLYNILEVGTPIKQSQAFVSLRMVISRFLKKDSTRFNMLDPNVQSLLTVNLFRLITPEKTESFLVSVQSLIVHLATFLIPVGLWNDFNNHVLALTSNNNLVVKITGVEILGDVIGELSNNPHHDLYISILDSVFMIDNVRMLNAATKLCSNIILYSSKSVLPKYTKYCERIYQSLRIIAQDCLNTHDPTLFTNFVNILMEVIFIKPNFLDRVNDNLLKLFLEISVNKGFDESARIISLEYIFMYCDRRPRWVSNRKELMNAIIDVIVSCLNEIEETNGWFSTPTNSEDEEHKLVQTAEYAIEKIASCLETVTFFPMLFNKLNLLLKYDDWRAKSTAFLIICQTCEYFTEEIIKTELPGIFTLLLNGVSDKHYRVRYEALYAIAQIAVDHYPDVQLAFHQQALPIFINAFNDPVGKVQAQAFSAYINFVEQIEPEDLYQYIDTVLNIISRCLSDDFIPDKDLKISSQERDSILLMIRELAVTVLSVTAIHFPDLIIEKYPNIISLLKYYASLYKKQETEILCSRSLEFLSIISFGSTSGSMTQHYNDICQALINIFNSNSENQQVKDYSIEAIKRMAKAMKAEFIRYAEYFIVPILKILSPNSIHSIFDLNSDANCNNEGYREDDEDLAINTEQTEEVERYLVLLITIAEVCDVGFSPFIDQLLLSLNELLKIKYPENIQSYSLQLISIVISIHVKANVPKEVINNLLINTIRGLFLLLQKLEGSQLRYNHAVSVWLDNLILCIESAGVNVLSTQDIDMILGFIIRLLESSTLRRSKILNSNVISTLDDDELDYLKDDLENEQAIRVSCTSLIEATMKLNQANFHGDFVAKLISIAEQFVSSDETDDSLLGYYIATDIFAIFRANSLPVLSNIVEASFKSVYTPSALIERCICYLYSLILATPNMNNVLVTRCIESYEGLLTKDFIRKSEFRPVLENIASGIINSFLFYPDFVVGKAEFWWKIALDIMPLTDDIEESAKVHTNVINLFSQPSYLERFVVSQDFVLYAYKKLYLIFLQIYNTPELDDSMNAMIEKFLRWLISLPTLEPILRSMQLNPKQLRGYKKLIK